MVEILQPKAETLNVELLDGLVGIRGEPVGDVIVRRLLCADINRVLVMGQPSAGKSTVVSQIDHSLGKLAKLFKVPLAIAVIHYDDLLKTASRRKPPDPDTAAFNERLTREILQPPSKRWTEVYSTEGSLPKRVVLAEVPAVGYSQPKDRGVSAFETLARETDDTLFLYVVAHPLSQRAGADARFIAAVCPSRDVVRVLRQNNIIIEAPGIDDEEALGRRIKATFRWSAKARHITAILAEMARQFVRWHYSNGELADEIAERVLLPESYHPAKISQSLLDGTSLLPYPNDDPDDTLDESLTRYTKRHSLIPRGEAIFTVARFRDLGIPEDRGIVAFSPPIKGLIHLHIKA